MQRMGRYEIYFRIHIYDVNLIGKHCDGNNTGSVTFKIRKNDDLKEKYYNNEFEIIFNFLEKGKLEFYKVKGRPKRLIDRR